MISLETLQNVLMDNRQLAESKKIFPRNISLDSHPRCVLVGVRRSGKSYLLFRKIQELLSEGKSWDDMLYLNFEDERLLGFEAADFNSVLAAHAEMTGRKRLPTLFLDEIQIIDGWEKFARRMADAEADIYITGSNAKMLSTDVSAALGGRFITVNVFPLSFSEVLTAKGIPFDKNAVLSTSGAAAVRREYKEYARFGGFPECLNYPSKREYLNSLLQKIYLGDIAVRNKVSNIYPLRVLLKKIADSVGQPLSYTRLTKIITAVGAALSKTTCINYAEYARQACLMVRLDNFVGKLVDKESNPKFYFIDTGLIDLLKQDAESDQLENLTAIELLRRYGNDDVVFFYKRDIEVDFYVPSESLAVQACLELGSGGDTEIRETEAFVKMAKEFPVQRRIIITRSEERVIDSAAGPIEVIPAWKWLLT